MPRSSKGWKPVSTRCATARSVRTSILHELMGNLQRCGAFRGALGRSPLTRFMPRWPRPLRPCNGAAIGRFSTRRTIARFERHSSEPDSGPSFAGIGPPFPSLPVLLWLCWPFALGPRSSRNVLPRSPDEAVLAANQWQGGSARQTSAPPWAKQRHELACRHLLSCRDSLVQTARIWDRSRVRRWRYLAPSAPGR